MIKVGKLSPKGAYALLFAVSLVLALLQDALSPEKAFAANTTYYVDSAAGSDSNSGTSQNSPWQSLNKVNSVVFQPGDTILFKSGSAWTGTLAPQGSGNAAARITFDKYGSGANPIINGNGAEEAVKLYNVQYVTVQNLELTNDSATVAKRHGILVAGQGVGTLNGIYLRNLNIHNVKGISDRSASPGMYDNAAIYVTTWDGATGSAISNFNDIRIENNNIHDISTIGMYFNGTSTQWNDTISFSTWNTNVAIRNNVINRTGADLIVVGYGNNPVIENNAGYDAGINGTHYQWIAGMWSWATKSPVFQYNEVARTHYQYKPESDSAAFDVDVHTYGTHIFQYNYSHNNAGGFMMTTSDHTIDQMIVRYNISQNDDHSGNWNDQTFNIFENNAAVYNNTFFNNDGEGIKINDTSGNSYNNNIFYSTTAVSYPASPTFDYNLYYGHAAPARDAHKVAADPQLVNPGSGGDGRSTADGYKLKPTSPAINAGKVIANNGGKDYWGNPIYNGAPDIGANEYTGGSSPAAAVTAYTTTAPIAADGNLNEAVWSSALTNSVAKPILGLPNNTVKFGVLWDSNYLYVGIQAQDASLFKDSTNPYDDDSFDIYIDANHNKGTSYDSYDRQFVVRYNDIGITEKNGNTAGVLHGTAACAGGFCAELAIPWSNLGITPGANTVIGFDIANNDDDDGGARDSQSMWAGNGNDWTDTSAFGDLTLSSTSAGSVTVLKANSAPTIDGNLTEPAWNIINAVAKTVSGTPNNTVTFGALWDSNYLYIGVTAQDGNLYNDSANMYDDDSFDIYIDANHNKGTSYDAYDRQFTVRYNDPNGLYERNNNTTGVLHAVSAITGGFSAELAIPWSNLGVTPSANMVIGLDVANNDDDNGGARDSQMMWNGNGNDWTDTSAFGDAVLSATVATGDTSAPTAPTGLYAPSKSSTTVNLTWNASSDNVGVTGYNIYNGAAQIGSTSGAAATSYTVAGLTANTTYSFTVKAIDAAGNVSAASNALSVTTTATGNAAAAKQTDSAPTVDGNLTETGWKIVTPVALSDIGTGNNTVKYGLMWDTNYLYIGIQAQDNSLKNDSANMYDDDSFDVYIDANHNKGTSYDSYDRQFTVRYNDTGLYERNNHTTGVLHAVANSTGGFSAELAIPWTNLGVTPTANMTIGLDIANNDDDDGGARDSQLVWNGTANDWIDTSAFGDATLVQ
jgi:chitodextrinase